MGSCCAGYCDNHLTPQFQEKPKTCYSYRHIYTRDVGWRDNNFRSSHRCHQRWTNTKKNLRKWTRGAQRRPLPLLAPAYLMQHVKFRRARQHISIKKVLSFSAGQDRVKVFWLEGRGRSAESDSENVIRSRRRKLA